VPLLWKTNGFLTAEALAAIAPALSAVNLDLKAIDETRHRALTGAPLAPVLRALEGFLAAGVWVEVSTPVIPGFNDDERTIATLARTLHALGPEIPWHLVRFVPELRMLRFAPTPPETLARAAAQGREAGLRFVYVERALGEAGRATRCPDCESVAVRRGIWTTEDVVLRDGACASCGRAIPGRW
jgi:pyruvate formate lyase activating enzyme